MNTPSSNIEDKREKLLSPNEIQHWHNTSDGKFRIGVKNIGEIRMGVEGCNILVQTSSSAEWINFGNYKFMYAGWNNPFLWSEGGEFLALHWVYFHVHGSITPIVINLAKKEFCFLAPTRILTVQHIIFANGIPMAVCNEIRWIDSQRQEFKDVEIPIPSEFRSIEEFYSLDPMTVETDVYSWKDKMLTITPLSEYRQKGLSEK
jgi:hypothetical protein